MRSALVCVCVVRSTLFHCLFSTYICTYVYTYVYMCMVYYSGFFFSVLFCVYSVWYPRASTSPHASTHLQSIITLLNPLPLAPPCSHHNPIFPLCALYPFRPFSFPNLYLLPVPPILHSSTTPTYRSGTWTELFAVSLEPICHWPSLHLPCWCVHHCWPYHSYDQWR